MSQISKECALEGTFGFLNDYGTFNIEHPAVLYIHGRCKVKPTENKTNYNTDIQAFKKQIAARVAERITSDNVFSNQYLWNCDVSENNLKFNKKSNLRYEMLVKPQVVEAFDSYRESCGSISSYVNAEIVRIMQQINMEVG